MDDSTASQINIKILTKCPVDKLTKLLHSVCDGMCGRNRISYADFESIYSLEEWWEVLQVSTNTLKNLINEDDSLNMIPGLGLSPDYQKVLKDCVISRKEDLRQAMLGETAADGAGSYLKDFDWNLKLVMGSDKVSEMREALASMHFSTQQGRQFTLEMNKKELAELIQALENANKAISQLQT